MNKRSLDLPARVWQPAWVTTASSQRRTAWAIALVGTFVALAVHLTSQVGRNGCVRHGLDPIATAAAPHVDVVADSTSAHAACALCAAPAPGVNASITSATPTITPTVVRIVVPSAGVELAAGGSPLDYAPKTSPPAA